MFLGLRIMRGFSRRRLFGVSIAFAAVPLALIGLIPNLVVAIVLVVALGACAGIAYVTGYTIVGLEVDDDTRGRTFAFLQSAIRVILFAVIAIAPSLAAGITAAVHGLTGADFVRIGRLGYGGIGDNVVLLLAAVVAVVLGVVSYRQMDDRRGVPLLDDLSAVFRGEEFRPVPGHANGSGPASAPAARRGLLLALEGGEGPASRPRPGCSRSGCAIRDSTSSRRTSRARPRSGCGCVLCCSTLRTPACPTGPRR